MTERQRVVFSVNPTSLKKMAEYLHRDYSEPGNWSSPEQLFSNFLKKVVEELEDSNGISHKSEEFVDGEIRFSADCGEAVAVKAAQILEVEGEYTEEDQIEE